jgi:hypothetical protein
VMWSRPGRLSRSTEAPVVPVERPRPPVGQQAVVLPLAGTKWVTVHGSFPLSRSAWDQMLAMLEAMKPGLVESGDEENTE